MLIAYTATAFWHHFPPWILKNMDLETVSHFGTPIKEIQENVSEMGLGDSQKAP